MSEKKVPSYRITIVKKHDYWLVKAYTLLLVPIYEPGGSQTEPARVEERWERLFFPEDDAALFHWEARIIAWKLKRKLESDKLFGKEEIVYERKG